MDKIKNKKNLKKAGIVILIVAVILVGILIIASKTGDSDDGKNISTLEQFSEEKIGMLMGAIYADVAMENGTLSQDTTIKLYNTETDTIEAVRSGKVTAAINSDVNSLEYIETYDDLMFFPESLGTIDYAFGFRKGNTLRDKFNEAMAQVKAEGAEDILKDKWFGDDESKKVAIEQDWPGENGTLEYWVNIGPPPMAYLSEGGEIIGYTIDFVYLVAEKLDYKVNVTQCQFSGLIPALQCGKADLAGRSMVVTEERKESIDFSNTFYTSDIVLIVKKSDVSQEVLEASGNDTSTEEQLLQSVKESFINTFITEDRWKMFAKGIGVTLAITFFSIIFGTLLGLVIYFLYSRKLNIINKLIMLCCRWLSGVPVVVVLMIMYYIIFGSSELNGIIISIITFTILFGIGVFELIKTGVNGISDEQIEGGIDLGFSTTQIFTLIIFPQVVRNMLPLYRGKIVEHLKATAIVGYIAIQDLTQVCDLIRSRTFEAFFPLIVTAIIYYFLGKLLSRGLIHLEKKLKPGNHKSRLLKGVEDNDQN